MKLTKKLVTARRKIKRLRASLQHYKKKSATLSDVIKSLCGKVTPETLETLAQIGPNEEFLQRQITKKHKYGNNLKAFSLTLHFYSVKAYNFVRNTFNSALPHPKTISRWYKNVNGEAGFTLEVFQLLKKKVEHANRTIICSLVIDEMAIRQHVEFDGVRYYGFVDYGIQLETDSNPVAKEALVFMLVGVNESWKLPLGYFLIDSLNGLQKHNLLIQCLKLLNESGIHLVSITFDGASNNITLAKQLGCNFDYKNINSTFVDPNSGRRIAVFFDPCHMVKLIRNTLGEKKVIIDDNGGTIKWDFLTELCKLQDEEGLHLANKMRKSHIFYSNQKMKVKLATQLFSQSVAHSLEYCNEILKLEQFKDSEPTVKFIRYINNLFDILNSRNLHQLDFKKPISMQNFEKINSFLCELLDYLKSLRLMDGKLLCESGRKMGFVGFLFNIESLQFLYKNLIYENNLLLYFPTYKISQDHIELFFGQIRSLGGYNNNPSAKQFKSAYKKMMVHLELRDSFKGNCIPLEAIPILTPSEVINKTCGKERISEVTEEVIEVEDDEIFHNALNININISEFKKEAITYIAGFVVKKIGKILKCEECVYSLSGDRYNLITSFINQKDKGQYLFYPSEDVMYICLTTEKILQIFFNGSETVIDIKKINIRVLKIIIGKKNLFESLNNHFREQNIFTSHFNNLIELISSIYATVRIHHYNKSLFDKSRSIRSSYNKLVLFKGQ